MKLLTTIKPRTQGTVTVRDAAGVAHVFKPDEAGVLVCDIEDPAFVGKLLVTGDFEPLDEADHAAAEALLRQAGGGTDEDEAEGGDGDDEGDANALPEEANTPPRATKKPRGKAN